MAAGDFTGDGRADLFVGAGPGGGSHVMIFDGVTLTTIRSFLAYDPFATSPDFPGGVRVATLDIALRGRADVVTGPGPGSSGGVLLLLAPGLDFQGYFSPLGNDFTLGLFVA